MALNLVWEVFLEFEAPDYPQEGIDEFHRFLNDPKEMQQLQFFGAFHQASLVGVLAMRKDHICLFFVSKAFHRRGVGKALFRHMLAESAYSRVTVNSSPYAREIYKKLGFIPTDNEQIANGIRYIPMCFGEPQRLRAD